MSGLSKVELFIGAFFLMLAVIQLIMGRAPTEVGGPFSRMPGSFMRKAFPRRFWFMFAFNIAVGALFIAGALSGDHSNASVAQTSQATIQKRIVTANTALAPNFTDPGKLPDLAHMDYFHARKIIIDHGWWPVDGPCLQVSTQTCIHFPEIDSCSGVEAAPCGMNFARGEQCLYVGTSGGEPEGDEPGDTHVESVSYARGPCTKN